MRRGSAGDKSELPSNVVRILRKRKEMNPEWLNPTIPKSRIFTKRNKQRKSTPSESGGDKKLNGPNFPAT